MVMMGSGAALVACVAAFAQALPVDKVYEDGRRFVVTRGCPSSWDAGAPVRLFVAVPSAAAYARRRQWARATWCRDALASGAVAVKFFVGREPGASTASAEVVEEASRYGDVAVVPSWDGQDNVTAKQARLARAVCPSHSGGARR